jgi:hypothetical protein
MKTAASLNIPVDGHIPLSTSLDHAISSGQKMIAHSEELPRFAEDFSAENIQDLSTRIAEADIWNYIYANLYKPIPESHRAHIKEAYDSFQLPFVNAFHASGGKLLSGSDVLIPANLPGFTLHGELETSGTIEPGKNANLVLLNANPLEDISNTRTIEGAIFKGRLISKQEIDSRLEQIAESYSELALSKNQ